MRKNICPNEDAKKFLRTSNKPSVLSNRWKGAKGRYERELSNGHRSLATQDERADVTDGTADQVDLRAMLFLDRYTTCLRIGDPALACNTSSEQRRRCATPTI